MTDLAVVPSQHLAFLDQAKRAIASAETVEDLKDIRDKAEAIRQYAKVSGASLEIQNSVAEMRIRAERRAGELLKDTNLKAGRPKEENGNTALPFSEPKPPKLSDIGISKMQSSRFQQVAALPEADFEQHIADTKARKEELTTWNPKPILT